MTLILHRDGQKERVDSVFTPKRVLWVKIVGVFDRRCQEQGIFHQDLHLTAGQGSRWDGVTGGKVAIVLDYFSPYCTIESGTRDCGSAVAAT